MTDDPHLHLVGPDAGIGEALAKVLADSGIPVRTHRDADRFLEACPPGALGHACLMIDADALGSGGVSLVKTLRDRGEGAAVIVLSRSRQPPLRRQALAAGATDVLDRSLIDAYLVQRLAQLWPRAAHLADDRSAKVELADGTLVSYRKMTPEDAAIEQEFVRGLSELTRYRRFFSGIRELSPDMLEEFTNPHYPYSFALIATVETDADGTGPRERQIGVARYLPTEDPDTAEFAVVVADEWQRRGIASQLMHLLTMAAALAGIGLLEGLVLRDNRGMLAMCERLGFLPAGGSDDPGVVRVVKELRRDAGDGA